MCFENSKLSAEIKSVKKYFLNNILPEEKMGLVTAQSPVYRFRKFLRFYLKVSISLSKTYRKRNFFWKQFELFEKIVKIFGSFWAKVMLAEVGSKCTVIIIII